MRVLRSLLLLIPILAVAGTLFVPWAALEEPCEIDLPWHARYASLWWREAVVESGIRDTDLSLVVPMAQWTREFAPQLTGD